MIRFILTQAIDNSKRHPIYFVKKSLASIENNYTRIEKNKIKYNICIV